MANQKFSVEEILKEYQSDEATKGKKESPSGKLETQKMLNHAAGRRNVPPSTEASAEAYSYASSRTRQRTPYSPYRSEMAANINQIKQNRYQRRTDVEESRTAAFQTLELMRPKVSFVRSPAIRPQTTPNPKSDLLILDDLGTEFDSSFYQSTIYNLINTRLNRSLPTIISTNLDFNGISNRYEERITSRIYANYSILRFVGQDVRIMKAQQAFRKEKERGNRP